MNRLATLCAIVGFAAPAFAQAPPRYHQGTLTASDGRLLAGVQHWTSDEIKRERLSFGSVEDAHKWAFEAASDKTLGGWVLVEVRAKMVVRLSGRGLSDPKKVEGTLHEVWREESAAEEPDLLLVRNDNKVAALGKKLPADPKSKLDPTLTLDVEAARPLVKALEKRKVTLPPKSSGIAGQVNGE